MPARKTGKRDAPKGGNSGRSKANPPKPQVEPSRWPKLRGTKAAQEPLVPQPGYAFLSLRTPGLALRVAEREWPLVSSQATLWHSYKDTAISNQASELLVPGSKFDLSQIKVSRESINANAGFSTLKYGTAAWERSDLPLVHSWKAYQIVDTAPELELEQEQRPEPKSTAHAGSIKNPAEPLSTAILASSVSNELVSATQIPTPAETAASVTTEASPDNLQSSPIAPGSSPLTAVFPQRVHPLTPVESTDLQKPFVHKETEGFDPYEMSSKISIDAGGVDESIKDVIQNLFVLQGHVASFRPEHQDGLNRKVEDIAVSLQKLDDLVSNPSNPIHNIKVAPDIIDYVDDGRNPDIYTRDFVELVQRGNAVLNGKQKAFRNFSKIFAKALKENFDGMQEEVDTIMGNAGMEDKNGSFVERQQNGSST